MALLCVTNKDTVVLKKKIAIGCNFKRNSYIRLTKHTFYCYCQSKKCFGFDCYMKKMIPNNPAVRLLLSSDAVILQAANSILSFSLAGSTSATFTESLISVAPIFIYAGAVLIYK
jgi:hypothetical protein